MKCIKADLPESLNDIEIEIFSDLHLGSTKCDMKSIQERIERVKKEEHVYCILLGDIVNNSTKTSVGDVYSEPLSPMQEMQLAVSLFEPIKDKILGITAGNHERRSYKTEGVDLMWFLARELGLESKYDYCAFLLFIRFGTGLNSKPSKPAKNCITLYASHGDGSGGRLPGAKANALQKRGQIVNANIVVHGHTHLPLVFRDAFFEINYGNSTVHLKEQLFVNASASLNYEEYAELYGLKPSSKKCPVIHLHGGKNLFYEALI